MDFDSLGDETSHVLLLEAGDHHAGSALLPVHWGSDLPGGRQLETVHHTDDLVKVTSSGGRVQQGQLQPLFRTNHEHSSTNITMLFLQTLQCNVNVQTLQCIEISLYKLNKMRFPSYLAVKAIIPLASFSSGSIIPYISATFLLGSAMMG